MIDIIALTVESKVQGVPEVIRIIPTGHVKSQKGDMFVDEESFQMINKEFERRKLDLVVDYEHQTLLNVQAPAAGWIKKLKLVDGAIAAKVEWTEKARNYLENKEYKYISPVVKVRKSDKKVIALHSVALTNTPAVDGMFAICKEGFPTGGEIMDLKELAAILGLPEEATEDDVRNALKMIVEKVKDDKEEFVANSTVLGLLGLKADASTAEVSASIMSLKNGNRGTNERLKKLEEEIRMKGAEDAVDKALKDGKITAAQKEWAMTYALRTPEGFQDFVAKAPTVVQMGKMALKDSPKSGGSDYEEVLKCMGISKEDSEKYGGITG